MSEVRFTDYYSEEIIPPAPAGFQRPSAGAVVSLPEKLKAMKEMANSYDYNDRASALVFYRQGVFAADYEDDYRFRGTVRRYYPTYSALTNNELRGYFGWRTRFRAGQPEEEVPSSLVYIYIYEILNGIGVTLEEGLEKLFRIDALYGSRDPVMRQHLKVWIPDYLVYYDLPSDLAPGYVDTVSDQGKDVLTEFLDAAAAPQPGERVRLPENTDTEGLFRAMADVSAFDLRRSALLKKDPAEAEFFFARTLYGLAGRLKPGSREPLQELWFGRRAVRTYRMFRSAVFHDHRNYRSYDYAVSPVKVFRCRDGIWMLEMYREDGQYNKLFGSICREMERQARQQLHLGRTLKDSSVSPAVEEMTADLVREYVEEREERAAAEAKAAEAAAREAARKAMLDSVKIDMSLLGEIRRDAAETRDSLIVEEENAFAEPEAAPGAIPEAEKPERRQAAPAVQTAPVSAPPAFSDTPLDPDEYFFLHALLYGEEWRSRLKERHIQLSMLADGINEKMMDLIGDTVIEFAGDAPKIIEDYTEDLREMIPE